MRIHEPNRLLQRSSAAKCALKFVASAILLAVGTACSAPVMSPAPAAADDAEITLSIGRAATGGREPVTLELLSVRDSRCPTDVQCVWAGHAAVTVRASAPGWPAQDLVIGTSAPAAMNLPGDVTYGRYRVRLVRLEPRPSTRALISPALYRATVQLSGP